MREVTINKSELLGTVRANLEKHVRDFNDAIEGYKVEAKEKVLERREQIHKRLSDLASRLDNEAVPLSIPGNVLFTLKIPVSHEKDYKQAIAMLEMSVDDTITLNSAEFARYVLDDWEWKKEFLETNSTYIGKGE